MALYIMVYWPLDIFAQSYRISLIGGVGNSLNPAQKPSVYLALNTYLKVFGCNLSSNGDKNMNILPTYLFPILSTQSRHNLKDTLNKNIGHISLMIIAQLLFF